MNPNLGIILFHSDPSRRRANVYITLTPPIKKKRNHAIRHHNRKKRIRQNQIRTNRPSHHRKILCDDGHRHLSLQPSQNRRRQITRHPHSGKAWLRKILHPRSHSRRTCQPSPRNLQEHRLINLRHHGHLLDDEIRQRKRQRSPQRMEP